MNLLEQLNAAARRFARDESGVVLAFTVIVFLSLFVIACSVYGVGENIRQRIELQNAADAAAYSAAVVQADAVSRVAAINKALAWTHVQMGRAVMDYDVDVWLELTIKKWNEDFQKGKMALQPFNFRPFTDGRSWIGDGQTSIYPTDQMTGKIKLNNNASYSFLQLNSFWMSAKEHWGQLETRIIKNRNTIKDLNQKEATIIGDLKTHINQVVSDVVEQNVGSGPTTAKDFFYSVICEDATTYFQTLKEEKRLLKYFDSPTDAQSAFDYGIGVWFKEQSVDGIQRKYEQQNDSLRADWKWHLEGWIMTQHGPRRVFSPPDGSDTVKGEDGKQFHDSKYYETEKVKAQYLKANYFDKEGAIVVSVARKLSNPLLFMLGNQSEPGMYAFFNPVSSGGGQPYAWAAAASRAGFKDNGGDGEYMTKDSSGWVDTRKNLSQWDWDAELIPLPWATDVQKIWNSSTWKPLNGSGGTSLAGLAGGTAPDGKFLH